MTNVKKYKELTDEAKDVAIKHGYHDLFASRDTVEDAGKYLMEIVETLDKKDRVGIITGIQVLVNTIALDRAGEK